MCEPNKHQASKRRNRPVASSRAIQALCALFMFTSPVAAQGLATGAEVSVRVTSDNGGPPLIAKPINVLLEFRDPATGQLRAMDKLLAWVRPMRKSNADCRDAAQMARARLGGLSRDVIALDRTLFVSVHEDGTLDLTDRSTDLATSNKLRAEKLSRVPDQVVMHAGRQSVLLAFAQEGEIFEFDEFNGLRLLASGLSTPHALVPDGGNGFFFLQGQKAAFFHYDGTGIRHHSLEAAATDLLDASPFLVVREQSGTVTFRSKRSGQVTARHALGPSTTKVIVLPGANTALVAIDGSFVHVHYGDSSVPLKLAAAFEPANLAASTDGRFLAAWKGAQAQLFDLGTSEASPAKNLGSDVSEVAFMGQTLFVRLQGSRGVQVFDLNQAAKRLFEPWLVRLGPQDDIIAHQSSGQLLLPAPESGEMLVGHPRLRAVFGLMEMSGMIATAMNSFSVAGDDLNHLARIDRKLAPLGVGRYGAKFVAQHEGDYELVITSAGFTGCKTFSIKNPNGASVPSRVITTGYVRRIAKDTSDYELILNLQDENDVSVAVAEPHVTLVHATTMTVAHVVPTQQGMNWRFVMKTPKSGDYVAILSDTASTQELDENQPFHFRISP